MNDLVPVDYLLLALLLASAIIGLFRGFLKEALSLVVWIVAIWGAWSFGAASAPKLPEFVPDDPVIRLWAARFAILVAILIIGGVLTTMLGKLLGLTGLTGTDRVVGLVFGLARGAILAGVVVILLRFAGFGNDPWWQESRLIPLVDPIAERLQEAADQGIEQLQTGETQP